MGKCPLGRLTRPFVALPHRRTVTGRALSPAERLGDRLHDPYPLHRGSGERHGVSRDAHRMAHLRLGRRTPTYVPAESDCCHIVADHTGLAMTETLRIRPRLLLRP